MFLFVHKTHRPYMPTTHRSLIPGVGKTTMAVVAVNDPAVREAFDAIGWVSIGQTPAILDMQRALFRQLTGSSMPVKSDATVESQLADLKEACVGKRWLIVLDDVSWRVLILVLFLLNELSRHNRCGIVCTKSS